LFESLVWNRSFFKKLLFIFIIGFTRIRLFIFIVEAFSDYFLGGKLSEELFKGWSLIENQVYKSGSSIIGGKL
jgi:hypothetical protein